MWVHDIYGENTSTYSTALLYQMKSLGIISLSHTHTRTHNRAIEACRGTQGSHQFVRNKTVTVETPTQHCPVHARGDARCFRERRSVRETWPCRRKESKKRWKVKSRFVWKQRHEPSQLTGKTRSSRMWQLPLWAMHKIQCESCIHQQWLYSID